MKLDERACANASAVLMLLLFLICALAVWVFPEATRFLFQSWFHGVDLGPIWSERPFMGNVGLGGLTSGAAGWLGGWGFARLYNRFLGPKK